MAANDSAAIDPITWPKFWHAIRVGGVNGMPSPGAIAPNGVRGFDRQTDWDKKKGKGVKGATLTRTNFPPAEGSFEFQLWLAEHFAQWEEFRPLLNYNPANPGDDASAFDMYYPPLADLNISRVVVKKISPIRHVGRGRYIVVVDMIEWLNPPAKSAVATVVSSNPDATSGNKKPGDKVDPNAALRAQFADAYDTFKKTPPGF